MGKATAEMLVVWAQGLYALDWAEVKVEGITAYLHTDLSKKESIDAAFAQIPDHIDCYFGIAGVSGLGTDFLTTTKIDLISNKYISECILTARMTEGGAIALHGRPPPASVGSRMATSGTICPWWKRKAGMARWPRWKKRR